MTRKLLPSAVNLAAVEEQSERKLPLCKEEK